MPLLAAPSPRRRRETRRGLTHPVAEVVASGRAAHPPRGATTYVRPVPVFRVLAVDVPDILYHLKSKQEEDVVPRLYPGACLVRRGHVLAYPVVCPIAALQALVGRRPIGRSFFLCVRTLCSCCVSEAYLALGEVEHWVGVRGALDVVFALIFAEEARINV